MQQHTFRCHFSCGIYCAKLVLVCVHVSCDCAFLALHAHFFFFSFRFVNQAYSPTYGKSFHFSLILIYGNNSGLILSLYLPHPLSYKHETSCNDAVDIDLENKIHSPKSCSFFLFIVSIHLNWYFVRVFFFSSNQMKSFPNLFIRQCVIRVECASKISSSLLICTLHSISIRPEI